MYKFFRDNQKRLLAFFGVILMIAFVMPSASKNFNDNSDPALGKIGNDRILMSSIRNAEDEWSFLERNVVYKQSDPQGKLQYIPVTGALGQEFQVTMTENPETYYLLQYEARKMGLVPKYDDAERAMAEDVFAFRDVDGTVKSAADLNDRARPERAREALGNLMMVRDGFMRAARAIKLSDPLAKHNVAQQSQQIKVRVADFMMRDYEAAVPAPTEDELKKQFDAYADALDTAGPTETNPFGFGYKFPNRVKLQYVEIPREQVRKTVRAQMTDYQWKVEANAYYLKHPGEFIGTTTAPADPTGLGLSSGATTRITTTKPINEVEEQIITQLVEKRADTLQTQIQNDLVAILSRDYENWLKANPNGPTTSASTTGPSDGFESYAYLQKVAQDILKRHNVTLTVASFTDSFKSSKELDALPGIGKTQQFGDIAVILAEPFVPAADKSRPGVLPLFKPSAVRQDDDSNRYFFRLTATEASHKPASLAEVKDQVEQDWKKSKSLDLAKADAQKLLELAKTTELEKAAADRKVIQTGEFSASSPVIDNYSLTSRGTQQFVTKSYAMLEQLATKTTNRPVSLIELPLDQRVVVAELVFVDSFVKPEIEQFITMQMDLQFHQQIQMELSRVWFDHDSIVDRLGYVDLTRKTKAQQSAAE